jgi:hypothetical protein
VPFDKGQYSVSRIFLIHKVDLFALIQQIANTAYLATLGGTDANLADFNLPDRQISIRAPLLHF